MAQMSLSDLTLLVRDFIPTRDGAAVARMANLALRELYMVAGPMKRWTLSTTAVYQTGTVAITQGLTAVTLTGGTFAAATDGQLIRVAGDSTWFTFTRTAPTTGTLSSTWTAASVTVATFEIAHAFYDLPTDIQGLGRLWRHNKRPLERVADERYAQVLSAHTNPGEPHYYALVKGTHATNSALRAQLIPFPDTTYSIMATGRFRPTQFPNVAPTTEYTGLPEELDTVLLAGTLHYLWESEDKQDRSLVWTARWRDGLEAASAHNLRGAVLEPSDVTGWNTLDPNGPVV